MKRTGNAYKKLRTENSEEEIKNEILPTIQAGNVNIVPDIPVNRIRFPNSSEQHALRERLALTEEKLEQKIAPARQDKRIGCCIVFVVGSLFIAYVLYVFYSIKSDNKNQMAKLKEANLNCTFDEYCYDASFNNNTTSILNCSSNTISDYCNLDKGLSSLNRLFNMLLIIPGGLVAFAFGAYLFKNRCIPDKQVVSTVDLEDELEGLMGGIELANLPMIDAIEIIQEEKITLEEKIKYRHNFFQLVSEKKIPVLEDINISSIVLQYLGIIPVDKEEIAREIKLHNR